MLSWRLCWHVRWREDFCCILNVSACYCETWGQDCPSSGCRTEPVIKRDLKTEITESICGLCGVSEWDVWLLNWGKRLYVLMSSTSHFNPKFSAPPAPHLTWLCWAAFGWAAPALKPKSHHGSSYGLDLGFVAVFHSPLSCLTTFEPPLTHVSSGQW